VGDTLEEIHEGFPWVNIAQIKAIIGWYFDIRPKRTSICEKGKRRLKRCFRSSRAGLNQSRSMKDFGVFENNGLKTKT
jgi:hypothetical protein